MIDLDIFSLTGHELKNLLLQNKTSAFDLHSRFFQNIEEKNDNLNAILYLDKEDGIAYARKVDEMIAAKQRDKPLLGIPIIIPDSESMVHTPSSFGCTALQNNIGKEDTIEIQKLKEAGTVILGKSNLAEFGFGYDTVNKLRGPCENPWKSGYSTGGYGGGAAAVASGLAPMALSADINGSLRTSASFCGLPGIMPSRGRVPVIRKYFLLFSEQHFISNGIISRDIEDMALFLQTLAEPDPRDDHCCSIPPVDYLEAIRQEPKKYKIGYSADLGFMPVDPVVRKSLEDTAAQLKQIGHEVAPIDLTFDRDIFSHFLHIFSTDRYIMIMRMLEENAQKIKELSALTLEYLRMGDKATAVQYSLAHTFIEWVKLSVDAIWDDYDLLLTPTMPAPPHPIGQAPEKIANHPVYPHIGLKGFLIPFNMSGHPAITLPCGLTDSGLPIGMQFVAPQFCEQELLHLAKQYEHAHPWKSLIK